MTTPKKKHLIELMIEAGVKWHDGAEHAAQDKRDSKVYFFHMKPYVVTGDEHFCASGGTTGDSYLLPDLCRNWNRTIVTREQYEMAVAEHTGAITFTGKSNQARESEDINAADAVEWNNQPTIEQLTADYRAKAAEAKRLQSVADEALKAADDALLALEKAGELIGLVISIDAKPKQAERKDCVYTEWSVGDKCVVTESPDDDDWIGRECVVSKIDLNDESLPYKVYYSGDAEFWVRSIRRP